MPKILGGVPEEYPAVELSSRAPAEELAFWRERRLVLVDSDAHTLDAMSDVGVIDLPERTVDALVERLRRGGGI